MSKTIYLGRDVEIYDKKFRDIVRFFLKSGEIKPLDPNRADSAAFRHMVDKIHKAITKEEEKELNGLSFQNS